MFLNSHTYLDHSNEVEKLNQELKILKSNFNNVNFSFIKKEPIVLGEGIIQREGENIPYKIYGSINFIDSGFSGNTNLIVRRISDSKKMGELKFTREWKLKYDSNYLADCNFDGRKIDSKNSLLSIRIIDYSNDEFRNFEYPVMRLLSQIAVEVFKQEPDKILKVDPSSRCNRYVLIAGGFQCNDFSYNSAFKSDLEWVRNENKLFQNKGNTAINIFLYKEKIDKFNTEFVNIFQVAETLISATLVDFEMNTAPITWEEQIRKKPVLSLTKGPILPRFYNTKPSRK